MIGTRGARSLLWIIPSLAMLIVLPLGFGGQQYPIYVLALSLVWAVVALGMNLLTGYTGQYSIGHAGFVAMGAYVTTILMSKAGLDFWLAVPVAGLVSAVTGCLLGLPACRLRGPYLAIATIGFGMAIPSLIRNWERLSDEVCRLIDQSWGLQLAWLQDTKLIFNSAMGLKVPTPTWGFGVSYRFDSDLKIYYLYLPVVVVLTAITVHLATSRVGRAFRAIGDSETAAQAVGISLIRYKTASFALSAFYAGIAGGMYALLVGHISPDDFDLVMSIQFLTMIVVGGLGSIGGSIAGAILLTILPITLSSVKNLNMIVYGAALIVAAMLLPGGLAGLAREFWNTVEGVLTRGLALRKPNRSPNLGNDRWSE